MEREQFIIKKNTNNRYLEQITVGQDHEYNCFTWTVKWNTNPRIAIHFTSQEEADATIQFLINVIDYELKGNLEIKKAQG